MIQAAFSPHTACSDDDVTMSDISFFPIRDAVYRLFFTAKEAYLEQTHRN